MNLTSNLHLNIKRSYEIFRYFVQVNNDLNEDHCYKLKASHCNTYKSIISFYYMQLQRADRRGTLSRQTSLDGIPFFQTSIGNIKSAAQVASVDTVRNHRKRFRDTGLFIEEHHIQCRGLMVQLCPLLLLDTEELINYKPVVDKYVKEVISARNSNFEKPLNLALNELLVSKINTNVRESIKREDYKPVDKSPEGPIAGLVSKVLSGAPIGALSGESKGRKYCDDGKKVAEPEKKPGVRTPVRGSEKKKRSSAGAGSATAIFLMPMVYRFWAYVALRLYAGRTFSEAKTQKIVQVLYENYFRNDRGYTEMQYQAVYDQYVERVEIAARYFARRTQLYVPDPEYYFGLSSRDDYERLREFKFYKTAEFLLKKRVQDELHRIRRDVLQHRKGQGPHRDKSLLQLYQIHENRIRALNYGPSAMKQFASLVPALYT